MALIALAVIVAGAAVVFAFGTPKATAPSQFGGSSFAGGEGPTEVPPPDPSSPFAIEIPGCVCHSDDPRVVEEHSSYRMNQCFGCHADGMPEMAR